MAIQKYILRTCPNTECEIVQWLVNKLILSSMYHLDKKSFNPVNENKFGQMGWVSFQTSIR